MKIRKYKSADCAEIAALFYNTVHSVNAKDYTKAQLDAWAPGNIDIYAWDKSFSEHNTLVAEENGIITGFGDMDENGYLDRLFVHKNYQRRGIAAAIVNELEDQAKASGISSFYVCSSVTAKSFFERLGYSAVSENTVLRKGIKLTNFIMFKCK